MLSGRGQGGFHALPESAATSVVQLNQSSGDLVELSANDNEGSQNPATRYWLRDPTVFSSTPPARKLFSCFYRLVRRMRAAAPRSAAAAASASASSARATPSTAPKELRRRRLGSASLGALPWVGVLGCGATGCELGGSSPARPPWGLWAAAMPPSGSAVTLSSSSAVGGGGEAERRERRSGEGRSAACSCA